MTEDIDYVSTRFSHSVAIRKSDILAWGQGGGLRGPMPEPTDVDWPTSRLIACGRVHTVLCGKDGVYTVGQNEFSQLGQGLYKEAEDLTDQDRPYIPWPMPLELNAKRVQQIGNGSWV